MVGVFERSSLVFLAGAVVVAVGGAVFWRSPEAPEPVVPAARNATAAPSARDEPLPGPAPEQPDARPAYDLEAVAAGAPVPRVFAATLPERNESGSGIADEDILKSMLPLVLLVNEEILAERRQLWDIRFKLKRGDPVPAEQRIWLRVVADRYAAKADDLDELGRRVDVVPPSIVLAVAEEELKRERQEAPKTARKAAPGERSVGATRGAAGDRPSGKHVGEMQKEKAPSLARSPLEHIRALAHAINTVAVYESFRLARAQMRLAGQPLDALRLASVLPSQRGGQLSGEHISALIAAHRLDRFDAARLQPPGPSG